MLVGTSAGGGLAAALSLYTRGRAEPSPHAQFLVCPILDDRDKAISTTQFSERDIWARSLNAACWKMYLQDRYGTCDVEPYAAPARATDFSQLPPNYIDIRSAEVFRDEVVQYASNIWAPGGDAELYVWPGGWHNFDLLLPTASLSMAAQQAITNWVHHLFARQ
ncbi:Alpha/Beta hydrolase protein [Aspergillus cavernicola]|uniref:Alpha/Beta hydrolase protein n=1 Tax=Aspergillus cavernicola TaxID=176166 RepID=A0ABR4IKM6_9EURO